MRHKDLFPKVHLSLRKDYVSVEEFVRELPHNKSGIFQPLSSFPLRRSFPRRGKITTLTKLPATHHNLRSKPVTPSHLGGKPPRVTNASMLVDVKSKCSSYEIALISSQKLS
jgi:hypothetical protein